MKKFNYQKGKLGEELARRFLKKKGYHFLMANFYTRQGEIDLIFTQKEKVIFVEVKLRIGEEFGPPEELINQRKIRKIKKTAQYFLATHPEIKKRHPSYRIDAICITLPQSQETREKIHYYPNIGAEL